MKVSKLEGIKLLNELGMPTVKLLDISGILNGQISIDEGISVRLSPKSKLVKWNVWLPSINRRTNIDEVREFVERYQDDYLVFAHKSVRPQSIGTLSKFPESVVAETYKSYEDKGDGIIDNRVTVPMRGDKLFISKMELLKRDETDFNNFRKVLLYLNKIPFSEYETEYVIEDNNVVFMDFTVSDTRQYKIYDNIYGER